jgi:hypothetical protein
MVFGSLILQYPSGEHQSCNLSEVTIQGRQTHFISDFTVKMIFQNKTSQSAQCKYIFPTDSII